MPSYLEPHEGSPPSSLLDDIFGDQISLSGRPSPPLSAHPSDIPRLQALHHTSGYREGFADAKSSSIQAGFDEGYSLGASIGLCVGRILGVLEGIAEATRDPTLASQIMLDARSELTAEKIFGREYWAPDGTWAFSVTVQGGMPQEHDGLVFADIAKAHPLINKWNGVINEEARRLGLSLEIFDTVRRNANEPIIDDVHDQQGRENEAIETHRQAKTKNSEKRGALEW